MAWLRRLVSSNSRWKRLHVEEAGKDIFNPVNSNMESLVAARQRISNPVWKGIYSALLKCKNQILAVQPDDYVTFPISGEPDLMRNHCGL